LFVFLVNKYEYSNPIITPVRYKFRFGYPSDIKDYDHKPSEKYELRP